MNTNKMLTYLLYALLAGLIAVAGYKTWQMKQEKAKMAKESADFQQSIRDLGFVENDTTESRFEGDENAGATPPPTSSSTVVTDDGIEDEVPVTKPAPQPKTGKKAEPATTEKAKATEPTRETQPRNLDTDNSDGRYRVVAGSFTKLDGARREMERIIKMGYHDAEVGLFNRGKFAVVIVKRTENLNEAVRIAEALNKKGIEASVIDRERRK